MYLTEDETQRVDDHDDAIMRIATVLAETAVESGVLDEVQANLFIDEMADLLGLDLDNWLSPAERGVFEPTSSISGLVA